VLGWVYRVPLGAVKGISEVAVDQLSELEAANQQGAQGHYKYEIEHQRRLKDESQPGRLQQWNVLGREHIFTV
jgi:hypothetical protein